MNLTQSDVIALIGALATVLVGAISWFISAALTKRTLKNMEITYSLKITPLISRNGFRDVDKLQIKYKNETIDELIFLEVDIENTGNIAIENPPIKISSKDTTYIIPAYLEDIPDGYDGIWEIEREDGETCLIKVGHINQGQKIKARFLLDQMPPDEPMLICPMANLKIKRSTEIVISPIILNVLEIFQPSLARLLVSFQKATGK